MTWQISYHIKLELATLPFCTLPSFRPLSLLERHGRRQKVQYLKIMNCRMTVRLRPKILMEFSLTHSPALSPIIKDFLSLSLSLSHTPLGILIWGAHSGNVYSRQPRGTLTCKSTGERLNWSQIAVLLYLNGEFLIGHWDWKEMDKW